MTTKLLKQQVWKNARWNARAEANIAESGSQAGRTRKNGFEENTKIMY
jgi:hypothetical protein